MTATTAQAPVPAEIAALLQQAHDARTTAGTAPLFALVKSLRDAGWTLQAIATPMAVTRECVRLWVKAANETEGLPELQLPPPPPPPPTKESIARQKQAMRRATLNARDRRILNSVLPELKELQPMAQDLRGPSEHRPEQAAASKRYTELLVEALDAGIGHTTLARELGIRPVTISARLRRHGYKPQAPSQDLLPPWADGPFAATSGVRKVTSVA